MKTSVNLCKSSLIISLPSLLLLELWSFWRITRLFCLEDDVRSTTSRASTTAWKSRFFDNCFVRLSLSTSAMAFSLQYQKRLLIWHYPASQHVVHRSRSMNLLLVLSLLWQVLQPQIASFGLLPISNNGCNLLSYICPWWPVSCLKRAVIYCQNAGSEGSSIYRPRLFICT